MWSQRHVPLDETGLGDRGIPGEHANPLGDRELRRRRQRQGCRVVRGGRKIPKVAELQGAELRGVNYFLQCREAPHGRILLGHVRGAGRSRKNRPLCHCDRRALIPADKLKAEFGLAFHGYYDMQKVGLPVAFAPQRGRAENRTQKAGTPQRGRQGCGPIARGAHRLGQRGCGEKVW